MNQGTALFVAGIVFAIVAIIHLLRLVTKFDIIIAGKHIPLWVNVVGLIVAGGLSWWMFAVM
ncbi:MAG TPA: hypothetical protein VL360_07430 [Gammaproteobacteria bacterium]|jgi:hypothetical protein|nr:hypothetical protein [Gammaproteobacteria bacterium]